MHCKLFLTIEVKPTWINMLGNCNFNVSTFLIDVIKLISSTMQIYNLHPQLHCKLLSGKLCCQLYLVQLFLLKKTFDSTLAHFSSWLTYLFTDSVHH